ncbi:MAG: metallophosphoesterase [Microscillaceae bacterium]|jgi:hypothetical protein|nr:metallophosphoesterase [Microscillaceae bacterium]
MNIKINRRKFIIGFLLSATFLTLIDWFWEVFVIKERRFYLGKTTESSPAIKIVQISDLHLQSIHWGIKRMVQQITRLQPDLICLTGDVIDKAENLTLVQEFLALLPVQVPKVAILGNWEYWGRVDLSALKKIYAQHNMQLLINQNQLFELRSKKILISGCDSLVGGQANYYQTIENHELFDFHLVMTHCPAHYAQISEDYQAQPKIDLIIAGHTHGGQINLAGYVPFLPQGSGRFVAGWYKASEPPMYVSRGVGTSIYPIRLGAPAEYAVFYIEA